MGAVLARFIIATAIVLISSAGVDAQPRITGINFSRVGDLTRIGVDLSQRLDYRVFVLNDPARVVIDLPVARWSAPTSVEDRGGLVAGYRFGLFDPKTFRLVFDLNRPVVVKLSGFEAVGEKAPLRLNVDLESVGEAKPVANAKPPPAGQVAAGAAPRPPASLRKSDTRRVIVVDPGHGGVDPGAIGTGGSYEKDVTLAYAKEFRRVLEATGRYRVVLTRDTDVFLRLRDRIAKAREVEAELFVSIHADSIGQTQTNGASVYTLSENASDAEAAALAAQENKADLIAGIDLSQETPQVATILIDLAQRETMNLSAVFAAALVGEMGKDVKLLPKPHRFAGFAVLKAPDVPSVLLEIGYLSNRNDEKQLQRRTHRVDVAAAMLRAIDRYFASRGALR